MCSGDAVRAKLAELNLQETVIAKLSVFTRFDGSVFTFIDGWLRQESLGTSPVVTGDVFHS